MHYIAYDPAFFINGKRSVAESYTEDRKYLYRFHSCNDILKRLYEVFEKSKKQDLTPMVCLVARNDIGTSNFRQIFIFYTVLSHRR
jgi:hypothetical protein